MARKVKLAAALHRTVDPGIPAAGKGQGGAPEAALLRVTAETAGGAGTASRRGFGFPAVGRVLSSAVYGAGYYTSFGIVFGVMTVWYLLPLDNALGRGLNQGGSDALERSRAGRRRAGVQREVKRSADSLAV